MKKILIAAGFALFVAVPAFAQSAPANNGVWELDANATTGGAPCYHCNVPPPPSDCAKDDARQACAGNGPYDERPYGSEHPGANGLNWQPKNGHDS